MVLSRSIQASVSITATVLTVCCRAQMNAPPSPAPRMVAHQGKPVFHPERWLFPFLSPRSRESASFAGMNAIVDPNGPALAVVPSNPVPDGARVGFFETSDKIRL